MLGLAVIGLSPVASLAVIRRGFRLGVLAGVLMAVAAMASRLLRGKQPLLAGGPPPPPPVWPPLTDPVAAPVAVPDVVTAPVVTLHLEAVAAIAPEPEPLGDPVPAPAVEAVADAISAPVKQKKKPGTKKPATKKKPVAPKALPPWVDPVEGTCPPTHPVKAKLASRLYHEPGMFAYDRTRPDRCYLDGATAEADDFTRAKR